MKKENDMLKAMAGLCLLIVSCGGAWAADAPPATPTAQGVDLRAGLVVRPSLETVVDAFARSGLRNVETQAVIDYDEAGTVLAARLATPTGHAALDAAILDWCRRARVRAGAAGTGRLPFSLSNEVGDATGNRATDGKDGGFRK